MGLQEVRFLYTEIIIIIIMGYSRKKTKHGGLRIWNFQGYQRDSMWNLQGLVKNEAEFSRVTKKN